MILVIALLVILVVWLIYSGKLTMSGVCQWCPSCLKRKSECTDCKQPVAIATAEDSSADEAAVLLAIANGCSYRLRGVVRAEDISLDQVKAFIAEGSHRMVLITNIVPEVMISAILSGTNPSIKDIKATALSSATILGQKKYIVMDVVGGKVVPNSLPTNDLDTSFEDLIAKVNGNKNNLVFLIDEDIPCPGVPKMPKVKSEEKGIEKCCGKMWD